MPEKRDLLTLASWSHDDIFRILSLAIDYKRGRDQDRDLLSGQSVALIFKKPSTRTRVSFDAALAQLGAHPIVLAGEELQMNRGETIEDTGAVLSLYVKAIVIRTGAHEEAAALARSTTVPVINALTDNFHPCQILADLQTIYEKKSRLTIAYIGDGNNVCNSLMIGAVKMGLNFRAATPAGYEPRPEFIDLAEQGKRRGAHLEITNSAKEAATGADILYTDVWTSMGQDEEAERRRTAFRGFQINADLMKEADDGVLVMHCLPAHRGEEVSAEAIDGPRSIVFDQAQNRLFAQKALLALLLG